MKREMKLVAVATAAAILAGCASGGGTSHSGNSGLDELALGIGCVFAFGLSPKCHKQSSSSSSTSSASRSSTSSTASTNSSSSYSPLWLASTGQSSAASLPAEPVPFTSWQDNPGDAGVTGAGLGGAVRVSQSAGTGRLSPTGWSEGYGGTAIVVYEPSGQLREFRADTGSYEPRAELAERYSRPGVDAAWSTTNSQQTAFSAVKTDGVAMVANPYDSGWNYQSFGVWTKPGVPSTEYVRTLSFGAATPGTAIPSSGSATFSGKLAGMFVSSVGRGGAATANLNVQVDFAARSLNLASTGTMVDNQLVWTPSPGLDVNGTLAYAPGSGRFSGTLVNAAGTMSGTSNGQFYGPAAQELGGEFVLKSPTTSEAFVGAYGAKR